MTLGVTIKFVGTIMDLFLPWILSYLIDVIVPRENMGGNSVLWISDAGLFRDGLGGKCHCQPDGFPGGQGYHPEAAARSVSEDFLSFLPADG